MDRHVQFPYKSIPRGKSDHGQAQRIENLIMDRHKLIYPHGDHGQAQRISTLIRCLQEPDYEEPDYGQAQQPKAKGQSDGENSIVMDRHNEYPYLSDAYQEGSRIRPRAFLPFCVTATVILTHRRQLKIDPHEAK